MSRCPSVRRRGLAVLLIAVFALPHVSFGGPAPRHHFIAALYNSTTEASSLLHISTDGIAVTVEETLASAGDNAVEVFSFPDVSQDGSQIVYTGSMAEGRPQLFSLGGDDTISGPLTNDPLNSHSGAAISPDGTRIAYSGTLDGGETSDLFVMNSDGSDRMQLTNTPGATENAASWSPDGDTIVYIERMDNPFSVEVKTIPAAGGDAVQVGNSNGTIRQNPAFSNDGTRILFTEQSPGTPGTSIVSTALDGSDKQVVHTVTPGENMSSFIDTFAFNQDGSWLAFIQANFTNPTAPNEVPTSQYSISLLETATGVVQTPVWDTGGAYILGFEWLTPELEPLPATGGQRGIEGFEESMKVLFQMCCGTPLGLVAGFFTFGRRRGRRV